MRLEDLLNDLNKVEDKSMLVSMVYSKIYPITGASMYDYSHIRKNMPVAVGICFRNSDRTFTMNVNDVISYLNNLINSDSGIGPNARIFIEADGYKGVPYEVSEVIQDKIKIQGRWFETVVLNHSYLVRN